MTRFNDKQGRSILFRPATVDDWEASIPFRSAILAESLPYLMSGPEPTPESQREFIENHQGDGKILFSAWDSEAMIGLCGAMRKTHDQHDHVAVLGISVARAYRSAGIGTN